MEKIELSGKDIFLTESIGKAYRVEEGDVLVFIVSVENGIPGRRVFVSELYKGDEIPAFYVDENPDSDGAVKKIFTFLLQALSPSVLIEIEDNESIRSNFVEKYGIKATEILGFEEAILEKYRIVVTKDARNIYAAKKTVSILKRNNSENILSLFNRKIFDIDGSTPMSGNKLYDAASKVCDWQRISHASDDQMKTACGAKFTPWDFARVSGFICREIVLEDNWYMQDAGAVLAFFTESGTPVALLPKGGKYVIYDGEKDAADALDSKSEKMLSRNAYMFYRPFPNKKLTISDIIRFILPEIKIKDVAWVIILTLLATLIGLLLPTINAQIYDFFIPMGNVSGLIGVCLVVLAFNVGSMSFGLVKGLLNYRNTTRASCMVQAAVYERLFNLPESFYRKHERAELAAMSAGINTIVGSILQLIFGTAFSTIFAFLYVGKMKEYAQILMAPAIVMILITLGFMIIWSLLSIKYSERAIKTNMQENSTIFQILNGIDKLRIAGAEEYALGKYMDIYTKNADNQYRSGIVERWNVITSLAMATIPSIVFYYMITVNKLGLSMGQFMGFTSAYGAFSGALIGLIGSLIGLYNLKPLWEQARPLCETLPEKSDDLALPGEINGDIEVNGVSFGYIADNEVLHNINLSIKAGEYIGIVGPSGCGKSTLLKLLLGFEKPNTGKIYYDGKDIDYVDKRELRKKLGVVLQNGDTIVGSIYENITIAAPYVKADKVMDAIEKVGLKEDIDRMPMGLYTLLSEGATGISGGQKQRILIARAIVNDPKVLYLDEATSALDNRTQETVCRTVESLGGTKIVIAHRLSTIMNCDRIFVMDKGCIVETGNFDELMARKGLFFKLANRQLT